MESKEAKAGVVFTCEKCGTGIKFKNAFPQAQFLTCKKCGGRAWLGSTGVK